MTAFPQQTVDQEKVQKNKDQTCKNELQLIFLGSEKQPLFECKCECNSECNCRFPWFSEILSYCQKPLKNKVTEKVSSAKDWLFQLYKSIIRGKERRDKSAESDSSNRNVFIAIRRAV